MALLQIGISRLIDNIDSDNSAAAVACRLYFDHCAGLLLRAKVWGFAERQEALQSLGTPPDDWLYRYEYPAACKRINMLYNGATRNHDRNDIPAYKEQSNPSGGKVILCDVENAVILYNCLIEDEEEFTEEFVQILSLLLAQHIAPTLKADAALVAEVKKAYQVWLSEAIKIEKTQSKPDMQQESEFVRIRY